MCHKALDPSTLTLSAIPIHTLNTIRPGINRIRQEAKYDRTNISVELY